MTPNPYQRAILHGLNALNKHVFAGIESPEERAQRRREDRLRAALTAPGFSRAKRRAVANASKTAARAERRAERRAA